MKKTWIVTRNILKRMFKKPRNILLNILLPVVIVLVMFAIFGKGTDVTYQVGVISGEKSASAIYILDAIDKNADYEIVHIAPDEANDFIIEGQGAFVLSVDKGFEDKILSGQK